MKITSEACVVSGIKSLAINTQEIEYQGQGTLIKITRGGICGSDLHYYQHGKVGAYAVKAPMVLGHEVIGEVIASDDPTLGKGRTVAINPSKPCHVCKYCLGGDENQCVKMRFFGSAMYFPHIDGGFTQYKIVDSAQCIPFDPIVDGRIMVFAEPLAVAIHAVNQAGDITGKRVFISGVGPIGSLVVAVAKAKGAAEIVTADPSERCRQLSLTLGADKSFAADALEWTDYQADKGFFDIAFEASGHPSSLGRCLDVTRAKGSIVLVGMGGAIPEFPLMTVIAKELRLTGTFRFTGEFRTAVEWLEQHIIDPLPLLSAEYAQTDFIQAMEFAGNKAVASKVQIVF